MDLGNILIKNTPPLQDFLKCLFALLNSRCLAYSQYNSVALGYILMLPL